MSDVLVVTEHRQASFRDVTFELLTAGRTLADATSGDLHVAVVAGDTASLAADVDREGVDVIHTINHGDEFNHDVFTQAVTALHEDIAPTYLVMPHSVNGLDYAPAVATLLDLPLVTDVVDIALDGNLHVTREMYGSKLESTLTVDADTMAFTLRPGEWSPAEGTGDAAVVDAGEVVDESRIGSRVEGFEMIGAGDIDITDADVLVSVGRGIEEEENLALVEALADAMGATLSSSRPIVDSGWLPKNRQVGQSGKVVTPDVYLAIGISGAVQHVAGMKGSDTIVAINTDPNAPIFDIADYGIVADLFDVVPLLIEDFGGEAPEI